MVVRGVAEELAAPDRARRPSPARCRSRAPRRPASCCRRPSRGRTGPRAGCPPPFGSGVTSATATAAPARWPAHGPTFASWSRCSRSRQTMNCQRWRFFELAARRPALRIRTRSSGSSGRSAELADDPLRADGVPDRHPPRVHQEPISEATGWGASRPRTGAGVVTDDLVDGARIVGRLRCGAERADQPDERPEAARLAFHGGRRTRRVGQAMGVDGDRPGRGLLRRVRAAEDPAEERRDGGAVLRELVQPRVLAALHGQRLDRRARRPRRRRRAAGGGRAGPRRPRSRGRGGSAGRSSGGRRSRRSRRRGVRAAGGRRGSSARRAARRRSRGRGDGPGGRSGGSGATDPPGPTSPRRPRPAGPPPRPGSPRSRPSNDRRSRRS